MGFQMAFICESDLVLVQVQIQIGFDGVRACRTVDFGRQRGGECRGGEKSQNAGGQ